MRKVGPFCIFLFVLIDCLVIVRLSCVCGQCTVAVRIRAGIFDVRKFIAVCRAFKFKVRAKFVYLRSILNSHSYNT